MRAICTPVKKFSSPTTLASGATATGTGTLALPRSLPTAACRCAYVLFTPFFFATLTPSDRARCRRPLPRPLPAPPPPTPRYGSPTARRDRAPAPAPASGRPDASSPAAASPPSYPSSSPSRHLLGLVRPGQNHQRLQPHLRTPLVRPLHAGRTYRLTLASLIAHRRHPLQVEEKRLLADIALGEAAHVPHHVTTIASSALTRLSNCNSRPAWTCTFFANR